MAWFNSFFERPEWKQKYKKKDGWITNSSPTSRRYLTPEGDEGGSIGPGQSEVRGITLDPSGEESEIEVSTPSTAVSKYTYDPKSKDLYLTFTSSSKEYCYPNVPKEVIKDFGMAPSKGRFVHDVITGYSVANGKRFVRDTNGEYSIADRNYKRRY